MKIVCTSVLLVCSIFLMSLTEPTNDKKGGKKSKKEAQKEAVAEEKSTVKSFHSIRKWKVTIEYTNGDRISKTIKVGEDSGISAMEAAFIEAERYLETMKGIKGYEVTPVSSNGIVLLAGD